MIPSFDERGNLPPGVHVATWNEIETSFGGNDRRDELLAGVRAALEPLAGAGCRAAYVDGSFVTAKEEPQDFDGCWEAGGVDPALLDPVLLDFSNRRSAQKQRFGGELFPADLAAEPAGTRFLDYFQRDRDTGEPKGIVAIDLGALR